jgi:hypothetical protein
MLTPAGWEYVFCWSVTQGRVITTTDYRKALRGGDREYIADRCSAELRVLRPADMVVA